MRSSIALPLSLTKTTDLWKRYVPVHVSKLCQIVPSRAHGSTKAIQRHPSISSVCRADLLKAIGGDAPFASHISLSFDGVCVVSLLFTTTTLSRRQKLFSLYYYYVKPKWRGYGESVALSTLVVCV